MSEVSGSHNFITELEAQSASEKLTANKRLQDFHQTTDGKSKSLKSEKGKNSVISESICFQSECISPFPKKVFFFFFLSDSWMQFTKFTKWQKEKMTDS